MKGTFKVRALVIVGLLIAVAIPMAAQTAQLTSTGSLNISGTVPKIVTLTVTPASDALTLNLTTSVTDHAIATVNEKSNVRAGYTLTLTSANGFAFKGAAAAETLGYSLKYAGTSFTTSPATLTDISSGKTAASGTTNTLAITYNGTAANLSEDVYSDVLTLTMQAK